MRTIRSCFPVVILGIVSCLASREAVAEDAKIEDIRNSVTAYLSETRTAMAEPLKVADLKVATLNLADKKLVWSYRPVGADLSDEVAATLTNQLKAILQAAIQKHSVQGDTEALIKGLSNQSSTSYYI